MLCDITYMYNLKNKSTQKKLIEKHVKFVVTRSGGWDMEQLDENGERMQTSNYKTNNFIGCNVQRDDYS